MELVAVKAFFTRGADELFGDKLYKLAKSRDFKQSLVHYLIKSSTLAAPVILLVKQQNKKAIADEAKIRQDVGRDITVKEKITPPSPLTGWSLEAPKTSKYDKKERKKDKPSSHYHSQSSSYSK